jgi:hypothetical protein
LSLITEAALSVMVSAVSDTFFVTSLVIFVT